MNPAVLITAIDAGTTLVLQLLVALKEYGGGTSEEMQAHLDELARRLEETQAAVAAYQPKDI